MSEELQAGLWGALLGALAGGLVSFISERHHDSRRRRQALEDQFADICFDFSASVQTYWSSAGMDNVLQASIISGINKMKAKMTKLGFDLVRDTNVRFVFKEIFQFSTGGGFATSGRKAEPARAKLVDAKIEILTSIVTNGGK